MIIICFSSSVSEQSSTTILQKSCPRDKFVVCSRIADVDRLERNKTKCDITGNPSKAIILDVITSE